MSFSVRMKCAKEAKFHEFEDLLFDRCSCLRQKIRLYYVSLKNAEFSSIVNDTLFSLGLGQLVAGQLVARTFGRNALSTRNMKFEKNRILLFFFMEN